MRKLVTEDLGLKSFKRTKAHNLNDSIRAKGLERCKALLQRFAPGSEEQILFSDEKIFTVEEVTNSQNDRILSKRSRNILRRLNNIDRVQKPLSVMVWGECQQNHDKSDICPPRCKNKLADLPRIDFR